MNSESMQSSTAEMVTVDQARQILHISKRKCAWMLQNGIIPCRIGEKKTRQYKILLRDIEGFASDYTEHPERYPLPPIFSANPNRKLILYPTEPPSDFRAWLDDKWYRVPDTLTSADVGKLLGYNRNSVNRWIAHKWLNATAVCGETLIAREWLMDFLCGSGWHIAKKSDKHISLLEKYDQSDGMKK